MSNDAQFEDVKYYKNLEQKNRICSVRTDLKEQGIILENLDMYEMYKYLDREDVSIVLNIKLACSLIRLAEKLISQGNYSEVEELKDAIYRDPEKKQYKTQKNEINPKDVKIKKTPIQIFKLEWEEITPYTILEIEEKEYTKEELLDIVGKRINFIKEHVTNKEEKNNKIDEILGAYNELARDSHKQK